MDRCNVVSLIRQIYAADAMGQSVPAQPDACPRREVYCWIGSVSINEWMEAGKRGVNPEHRIVMFAGEYQGEQLCEVDGKLYTVYRTYAADRETIELYLGRKAGVVGG